MPEFWSKLRHDSGMTLRIFSDLVLSLKSGLIFLKFGLLSNKDRHSCYYFLGLQGKQKLNLELLACGNT